MKPISVVVLNYNTERDTVRCLSSLAKVDYPDFEVVVVENGSDDSSARELSKRISKLKQVIKVKLVRLTRNVGYAGGCNAGVRETRNDHVVLLSNDTTVNRRYLKELVKTFEKEDGRVGIVVPKVINKGYGLDKLAFSGLISITGLPVEFLPRMSEPFFSSVNGCSLLFNKRIFNLPFDKDYFIYAEDVYLSWWSLLKGYKCVLAPKAVLTHKSLYFKDRTRTFNGIFHMSKNTSMNVLIFFELVNIFKVLPLLFVQSSLMLLTPLFWRRRCKKAIWWKLRSYWWLVRNFRKIWHKRKHIQSLRRVSDHDLSWGFTCRQPLFKGFFGRFVDSLIFLYCWVVRLPVREVYRGVK